MKPYLLLLLTVVAVGCTPRIQGTREDAVVLHRERGCILTILVDLSGSFQTQMIDDGKAHQFCIAVVDSYFRDRIGENDEIVIAQISGTDRALLWQGTPMQLRRDFSDPKVFAEFLRSRANANGSNVLANIAQAVEYVSSDPDIANGSAKSAVIILSDMLDNDPNRDAARDRLKQALATYGTRGGCIGCYYVDQRLVPSCREFIANTGIRNFTVQAEIVGNPQLPLIE